MALAPVALFSDPLEDYASNWIKFYAQGTTTPIAMAIDSSGNTTVAKAEISAGGAVPIGFVKTAGDAIFIPYVDEAYDLFLFPSEIEADANDTSNAIQLADNVSHLQDLQDFQDGFSTTENLTIVFTNFANLVSGTLPDGSSITLVAGQNARILGRVTGGDGGDNTYLIGTFGTADLGSIIDLDSGLQAKGLFPSGLYNVVQWGAIGDGLTDSTDAFTAVENFADSEAFDLIGGAYVITTTPTATVLIKKYFNGSINASIFINKPVSTLADYSVGRPRTKSHFLDWGGADVLWLGTSIPAEGGSDSYPIRFGEILDCELVNNAFAGSHATYDFNGDAFNIVTVKALSMTDADVAFGLATFGTSSAYDDSFDPITKASQMTAEFRIKNEFALSHKDAVILDHNHNDRKADPGILEPSREPILTVVIGSTTVVTVADSSSFTVGDAAAFEVLGIDDLNFATGRIGSIVSGVITVEYDSTGFSGALTSGELLPIDRNTIFGAWNFLIYFIKNMSIIFGDGSSRIILCGAPSEHTANQTYDPSIFSVGEYIKQLAIKWDLGFFDIGYEYDIKFADQLTYFPDGTHPSTPASRTPITDQWVRWAIGGLTDQVNSDDFLPAGAKSFNDQREALFDVASSGFITPDVIYTNGSVLVDDDFTGGLGGWVLSGTNPVIVSPSPWDPGEDSVFCVGLAGVPSTLDDLDSYGDDVDIEFDLYMPVVSGLIGPGDLVGTIQICQIRTTGAAYFIQIIATETLVAMRPVYFKSPNTDLVNLDSLSFEFAANTRYKIRWVVKKSDSASTPNGKMEIYIDDTLEFVTGNLDTFSQTSISTYRLQSNPASTVAAFDCYFGNAKATTLVANDYTQRFTGTFTEQGGATVTVVNGIITTVV